MKKRMAGQMVDLEINERTATGQWQRLTMSFVTRRRLLIGTSIILALLVLGQAGCAPLGRSATSITLGRSTTSITLRSSEEVGTKLGTIGVAPAQLTPQTDFRTPPKGAARAAGLGLQEGLGALGSGLGLLMAPVIVPLYAVAGAAAAQPAEEVEKAEAALKGAFADLKIHEALSDRVVHLALAWTDAPVVLLQGRGPTTPDDNPDYRSEAGEGINTVLDLRVFTVALGSPVLGSPFMDPHIFSNTALQLHVTAGARLVRTLDGAELFSRGVFHRSETATFAEWADKDAERLRQALSLAVAELAKEIVDKLVRTPSDPAPSKSRADGGRDG